MNLGTRIGHRLRLVARSANATGCGAFVALALGMLLSSGCQTDVQEDYRGKQVGEDVVETTTVSTFTCTLLPARSQHPQILVQRHDHVTRLVVPIFERIIVTRPPDATTRDHDQIILVPGEFIRGKPVVHNETLDRGPWSGLPLHIEGTPVVTDADGIVHDQREIIVRLFDSHDLGRVKKTVNICHPEFGTVALGVDREQLLGALGIDFTDPPRSSRDGVTATIQHPARVAPGETFRLTLTIRNTGSLPASPISGRTVARSDWLNGRNFYIGAVPAGESRSFSRSVTVPSECREGAVFGMIGLWDMRLGAMPEHASAVELTVVNASTP